MTEQPGRMEGADSERLPWIEPYREASSGPRPAPRKQAAAKPKRAPSRAPWTAIGALVLLTAGIGGGYWLGSQADEPQSQPDNEVTAEVAPVTIAPPTQPIPYPEPESLAPAEPEAAPPPAPVAEVAKPKPKAAPVHKAKAKRPVHKKIRHASIKRTQYERVVAKQRAAAKTWPKMPSPGPAGQVIQLGAFTTRARASNAYRDRIARYPVLSGMPQVIVPVITQPRGEILYVLRLGTQSREQSNVVCGNLKRSGNHCLVIG